MATPSRRTDPDLIEQLFREPFRFEFFQAVRLLERAASQQGAGTRPAARPVGEDESPQAEVARFLAHPSLNFPPGEIATLAASENGELPPRMTVPFLGLIGPAGVLPQHYTQLVIERIRRKDLSLRDFFDVFHHRLISLFYRAWRKYRFVVGYERAAESNRIDDDFFTYCLYSLAGMGTTGLRGRQDVDDETLLYYAGHFVHAPRNAIALEAILGDYLGVRANVLQFVGQWLYLAAEDQSRMPDRSRQDACNNSLGNDVVVGHRVWGVENRFRVRLGPLSYREFERFSPLGDQLLATAQCIRTYAGVEFDFDVQPVLRADEVPPCRLGDHSYLGWNTWTWSAPLTRDADDAVFAHEGWPTPARVRAV
jgi:type VI secretion system protein ImpH